MNGFMAGVAVCVVALVLLMHSYTPPAPPPDPTASLRLRIYDLDQQVFNLDQKVKLYESALEREDYTSKVPAQVIKASKRGRKYDG